MLMYIFNINIKTRYCNRWIRPTTFRKLQKYLKPWRFMMAHLNKSIDLYFQKRYKVMEYNKKHITNQSKPSNMEASWLQKE